MFIDFKASWGSNYLMGLFSFFTKHRLKRFAHNLLSCLIVAQLDYSQERPCRSQMTRILSILPFSTCNMIVKCDDFLISHWSTWSADRLFPSIAFSSLISLLTWKSVIAEIITTGKSLCSSPQSQSYGNEIEKMQSFLHNLVLRQMWVIRSGFEGAMCQCVFESKECNRNKCLLNCIIWNSDTDILHLSWQTAS